jgi:ribonuclease R
MAHRLLAGYLAGKIPSEAALKNYQRLVLHSSQMEQAAADAERTSIKYKQTEYMSTRVGQTFDGIISGVTDWGIFVEEKESKAEGLIRMSELGGDYYIFDRENYRIVGEKTKKEYRLGDPIRVKVTGVDMERRLVNYVMV